MVYTVCFDMSADTAWQSPDGVCCLQNAAQSLFGIDVDQLSPQTAKLVADLTGR